jgi:hypothetical protein
MNTIGSSCRREERTERPSMIQVGKASPIQVRLAARDVGGRRRLFDVP